MLKTALITSLAIALASASTDICTYTVRGCSTISAYGCCLGIAQDTCCTWPSNYGWSVSYAGMPTTPYWLGYAYGDTCTTETSGVGSSSGSTCASVFNGPTYLAWKSGSWDADFRSRRSLEEPEAKRDIKCASINAIGFSTADGEEHFVRVPDGKLDEVNAHLQAENFDELLKLEAV